MRWALTLLTALFLQGWLLSPWSEIQIGRGRSVQMADGFVTVRVWTGERSQPGTPADEAPEGGVPDTRNVPVWIVFGVLGLSTAVLWGWERWARVRSLRLMEKARRVFS